MSIFLKRKAKDVLDLLGYSLVSKKEFGNNGMADLMSILPKNTELTLLDIGANLGQTTIELETFFPKSKIYSFEPDPDTFQQLSKAIGSYSNIKAYNLGFGDYSGKIKMNINKASGGNSILSVSEKIGQYAHGAWTEKVGEGKIEIATIDSFCDNNQIYTIDLVKIDTQGYELKILNGGEKTIVPARTKAVFVEVLFVELYQQQAYFIDIFSLLTQRGYKLVGFYNPFYKLEPPNFLLWCDALFVSENA